MKKKLNLLWNLKFNFFSVAERPLTFFAYFLNAKKVGRRRLVIGPRKRGPSSFPTRGFRSRPGPCSRSVAFHLRRNRASGHRPRLLGLPRKIRRGISLRETTLCGCPLRGHGFATPHRYFAVPVTAAPRRGPNGKTPALVAVRLHFAARNRAGRSLPPPGATCSLPHFRFAQMWSRARTPALPVRCIRRWRRSPPGTPFYAWKAVGFFRVACEFRISASPCAHLIL